MRYLRKTAFMILSSICDNLMRVHVPSFVRKGWRRLTDGNMASRKSQTIFMDAGAFTLVNSSTAVDDPANASVSPHRFTYDSTLGKAATASLSPRESTSAFAVTPTTTSAKEGAAWNVAQQPDERNLRFDFTTWATHGKDAQGEHQHLGLDKDNTGPLRHNFDCAGALANSSGNFAHELSHFPISLKDGVLLQVQMKTASSFPDDFGRYSSNKCEVVKWLPLRLLAAGNGA